MSEPAAIAATRCWVEKVVIGMNLCPFAGPVQAAGRIRYAVSAASGIEQALTDLATELERLDSDPSVETTLFILPDGFAGFDEYLDLLALANELLEELGYTGTYQLASFHPHYRFEGSDELDPANCTNRSPYPVLHLIREASLERALAAFPEPEKIPQENMRRTRDAGLAAMRNLLAPCQKNQ